MSHETHETHHQTDNKPTVSFVSSFWFVVILAGLFIGAVNFMGAMGHDEEGGHGEGHATEVHGGAAPAHSTHEAGAAEHQEAAHPAADTTHTEGH